MVKLFVIILGLLFSYSSTFGQKDFCKQAKFSGTIINTGRVEKYDKIYFNYAPNDGFGLTNAYNESAKIDSNGNFKFVLPPLDKPYKLYIVIPSSDGSKVLFSVSCYTEVTDDVKLAVVLIKDKKSDSVSYSGTGSEKYELARKLDLQFINEYYPESRSIGGTSIKDSSELDIKTDMLANLVRKYQEKKMKLINSSNLSVEMKEIMNYEYGRYYLQWDWIMELFYRNNPNYRKQVSRNYSFYKDELCIRPNESSIGCIIYIRSLISRNALELMMINQSDKIDIREFYKILKDNYSGLIRDRLIGEGLLRKIAASYFAPYNAPELDSLLKDASKFVTTPYIKRELIEKSATLDKYSYSKVIDAEFIGLDGKKMNLKSLKGKVILIDTWFLGCAFCAQLQDEFKKAVYPKIKDKGDFVVLSINVDKNENNWIKGIASKKYTSGDHLNVSTGNNLGLDHPFLKYYGVKGSPWLLLIDSDGNIRYLPEKSSSQDWLAQINNALSKRGI